MPEMTNPANALAELQCAFDKVLLDSRPGVVCPDIRWMFDIALQKYPRVTYLQIRGQQIEAIAIFAQVHRIERVDCLSLGYAVAESARGKGLANPFLRQCLEELQCFMKKNAISNFYIEAIVARENSASNAVARRIISQQPEECVDANSGTPSSRYLKLLTAP